MKGVRGPLNAFRRSLILQAFDILDQERAGLISVGYIKDNYNANQHPEVKKGKKKEEEIYAEFL